MSFIIQNRNREWSIMNDYAQPKKESFQREAPDTAATLKKMQYQLNSMERKLDSLLKQSGPSRSNFNSSYLGKPHREHSDSRGSYKLKHATRSDGEKSMGKFYSGLQFGARKGPAKSSFKSKKRSLKR